MHRIIIASDLLIKHSLKTSLIAWREDNSDQDLLMIRERSQTPSDPSEVLPLRTLKLLISRT